MQVVGGRVWSDEQVAEVLGRRRNFTDLLRVVGGTSMDMNVDGSGTPVEFELKPIPGQLIVAEGLRIIFQGSSLDINRDQEIRRFGPAGSPMGLTNGLSIEAIQDEIPVDFFPTGFKSMWEFFNFVDSFVSFPDGIAIGEDLLVFMIELVHPILIRGTDRLFATVRDDLTDFTLLEVRVSGHRAPE